jgi:hypothetical protein
MRPPHSAVVLCGVLIIAAGCSKKRDPNATELGSGPKLILVFPEKPTIDTQTVGDMKMYNVLQTHKRPDGLLILGASVMENSGPADGTPQDLLEANGAAFKQYQTSNTSFTVGKKKHPGLEITKKSPMATSNKTFFEHMKIVVVGRNVYIASAASTNEEHLKEKLVQKFLDSLDIEE